VGGELRLDEVAGVVEVAHGRLLHLQVHGEGPRQAVHAGGDDATSAPPAAADGEKALRLEDAQTFAERRPGHPEHLHELVFGWEVVPGRKLAAGDASEEAGGDDLTRLGWAGGVGGISRR